jgi:hypothetical protein
MIVGFSPIDFFKCSFFKIVQETIKFIFGKKAKKSKENDFLGFMLKINFTIN